MSEKSTDFYINPKIYLACIAVLVISVFPFHIGFYTFTRIVVFLCSIAAVYQLWKTDWWIPFALIAILYNPIIPVHLDNQGIWVLLNLGVSAGFFWLYKSLQKTKKSNHGLTDSQREEGTEAEQEEGSDWSLRLIVFGVVLVLIFFAYS